jgi:hypothetical protein
LEVKVDELKISNDIFTSKIDTGSSGAFCDAQSQQLLSKIIHCWLQ